MFLAKRVIKTTQLFQLYEVSDRICQYFYEEEKIDLVNTKENVLEIL